MAQYVGTGKRCWARLRETGGTITKSHHHKFKQFLDGCLAAGGSAMTAIPLLRLTTGKTSQLAKLDRVDAYSMIRR